MNESVIYLVLSAEGVLCERRGLNGTESNCALGGSVEECDRLQEDYALAAASREAGEELGIVVERGRLVGEFVSEGTRFHVVLVASWSGEIPVTNRDNDKELNWVPLNAFASGIVIGPLREIVQGILKNPMTPVVMHRILPQKP